MSSLVSDCESCKILAVLSQFHLGHNATEIQTSDLLQKMCHLHPNAIPRCEGFVKLHGHRLLKSDGKQPALTACEKDYLCKGPKWPQVIVRARLKRSENLFSILLNQAFSIHSPCHTQNQVKFETCSKCGDNDCSISFKLPSCANMYLTYLHLTSSSQLCCLSVLPYSEPHWVNIKLVNLT